MIGNTRVVCNPRGYARLIGVNNFNKMCNEINEGKIPSLEFYEQMTIFRNENGDFDLVSYGVKIKLDNSKKLLRPGMTAFVELLK